MSRFFSSCLMALLVADLLSAQNQEKKIPPRMDLYGDPLPEGAVSRLGTVRFNHGGWLDSLFFAPGGKTLISAGSGKIRIWDAASGKISSPMW